MVKNITLNKTVQLSETLTRHCKLFLLENMR